MGFIIHIDTEEQEVVVQFQEREFIYDYADLNELALAWSVSIHKSPGFGISGCIFATILATFRNVEQEFIVYRVNSCYMLAIIIGSKKAIGICVRSRKSQERYTQLKERLINEKR